MLYHTVLFQFPEGTSDDVIEKTLERNRELGTIPVVQSIVVGRNTMPVTDGWAWGMTMVFESQQAMMAGFAEHPVHKEVFADTIPLYSRFMAMDVNTDPNEKGMRGDD